MLFQSFEDSMVAKIYVHKIECLWLYLKITDPSNANYINGGWNAERCTVNSVLTNTIIKEPNITQRHDKLQSPFPWKGAYCFWLLDIAEY